MALRLVQIVLPDQDAEEAGAILKAEPVLDIGRISCPMD
jgi:hypothetical protein